MSGEERTGGNEGDDLWYRWSTPFDVNFPAPQDEFSEASQWHANQQGSPPVAIAVGGLGRGADRWGIVVDKWNRPGNQGSAFTPWRAPVIDGAWNDIKVHIKWSVRDDVGFIELWRNGAPQTFGCKPVQFTRRTS